MKCCNINLFALAIISIGSFRTCSAQVVCDRSIYANTIGYASPHTSVTCNVGERCGRLEGVTTGKICSSSFFLSEPAYIREGCGDSSLRLSRHTSWFATTRLIEAQAISSGILNAVLPACLRSSHRPFPLYFYK